jgi:hypothetical protein
VAAVANDPAPNDYAGIFYGKIVAAEKFAAIKQVDGSHRLLYCMESPECWFEDFGKARLRRGRAKLRLRPDFAAVVRTTDDYHVFLTPEGDCNGLYIASQNRDGFEVRELLRGKSNVRFSYRIVARRKDVRAPRMPKVRLPALPERQRPPKAPDRRRVLAEIPKRPRARR